MLEKLANAFSKNNGTTLCWIKKGSGASLKLLKARKVALVMVHAPKAEKQAVKDGWGANRKLIGSNEFYIVGPKDDPAGIAKAKSAKEAYSKISAKKINFISRGDNSGTNKKEKSIWKMATITPAGKWYIITKDFMTASLIKANNVKGYFMTDSSTWVAAKKKCPNLKILFKGDPYLINTYHILTQPDGKMYDLSKKFVDFITSEKGQKIIRNFGKKEHGASMYSDAQYAQKYVH
jgi:tungstate transport system substrate-binding protein